MHSLLSKSLSVAAMALTLASGAQAASVDWQLENVTFPDGASAVGDFVYDASNATNPVQSWNITLTGGSLLPNQVFSNTTGTSEFYLQYQGNEEWIHFLDSSSRYVFGIVLPSPLTDAGGTVPLVSQTETNYNIPYGIAAQGGSIQSVSSVPEPATLMLMTGGLLALSAVRARKS